MLRSPPSGRARASSSCRSRRVLARPRWSTPSLCGFARAGPLPAGSPPEVAGSSRATRAAGCLPKETGSNSPRPLRHRRFACTSSASTPPRLHVRAGSQERSGLRAPLSGSAPTPGSAEASTCSGSAWSVRSCRRPPALRPASCSPWSPAVARSSTRSSTSSSPRAASRTCSRSVACTSRCSGSASSSCSNASFAGFPRSASGSARSGQRCSRRRP